APVSGECDMPAVTRRRGNRFNRARLLPRGLVYRDSQNTHVAAAVAAEVKMLAVRGPDGVPIRCRVSRYDLRLTARGGNSGDLALFPLLYRPACNAPAAGRPARHDSIGTRFQLGVLSGLHINYV